MRWYQHNRVYRAVSGLLMGLLLFAGFASWYYYQQSQQLQQQIQQLTERQQPLFSQLQRLAQLQQQLAEHLAELLPAATVTVTPSLRASISDYYQQVEQLQRLLQRASPLRQLLFRQSQLLPLADAKQQLTQQLPTNDLALASLPQLLPANTAALTQLTAEFNGDLSRQLQRLQQQTQQTQKFSLWLLIAVMALAPVTAIALLASGLSYRQRQRLQSFAEQNPLPILRSNRFGQINYSNPAAKALVAQSGKLSSAQQLLADLPQQLRQMEQQGQQQCRWHTQIDRQHYQVQATLLPDAEQVQLHLFNDSDAHQALQQLAQHTHFDDLTGLPNRHQFMQECEYWSKQAGVSFSFGSLNLQHFERVASQIDFQSADEVMQQLASRLSLALFQLQLPHARLYRFEGANFGVLLVHQHQSADLLKIARQLALAAERPLVSSDQRHQFHLSLSQGYASYPQQAKTIEELISYAELAAQQAKQQECSTLLFEAQMRQRQRQYLLLEADLRQAEQLGQLMLHYQPQLRLAPQQILGVEALLRWHHPKHGMISPAEFIPVAEQSGLIIPIGDWVLRQACQQAHRWHQQGLMVSMSVNLSAKQFRQPDFVAKIYAILKQTEVCPELIELELTESLLMRDVNGANQLMNQLKELGLKLAIDDFGTGYSSLAYLKRFPVDTLKIDRAFIAHLPEDHQDRAIVQSVLDMAKHLNLQVIAEGVETQEQHQWLLENDCDALQGFWFSRPLPEDKCLPLLQQSAQLAVAPQPI